MCKEEKVVEKMHLASPSTKPSVIDLSLSTPDLSNNIHWEVTDDLMGTHRPIFLTIERKHQHYQTETKPPKWRIHSADPKQYTKLCEKAFSDSKSSLNNLTTLNSKINYIQSQVTKIGKESVGTRTRLNFTCKPWWTPRISRLIRARKRARRQYSSLKTVTARIAYSTQHNKVRNEISRQKSIADLNYIRRKTKSSSSPFIWKALKNSQADTLHQRSPL
jgi:hypothetical protein